MARIDDVYQTIKKITHEGRKYLICGKADDSDKIITYLNDASSTALQTDYSLRFTAIESGKIPNDDGYYPVVVITGHHNNGLFMVDSVCLKDGSAELYFSVADNMLLSCENSIEHQARQQDCQDCRIGKRSGMMYKVVEPWDFIISPIPRVDACEK